MTSNDDSSKKSTLRFNLLMFILTIIVVANISLLVVGVTECDYIHFTMIRWVHTMMRVLIMIYSVVLILIPVFFCCFSCMMCADAEPSEKSII